VERRQNEGKNHVAMKTKGKRGDSRGWGVYWGVLKREMVVSPRQWVESQAGFFSKKT